MGLHSFLLPSLFSSFFIIAALSTLDFPLGAQVTIPIPSAFESGFKGRAFVLDARRAPPNFRVALSVEAISSGGGGGSSGYLCSLVVFLKETKVWTSDYAAKFLPAKSCVLKLTENGDLRLTDSVGKIGWRTLTSGRGVKELHLQKDTGNLILRDAENKTKWQSFDYPGSVLLRGQRLNTPARLTTFPTDFSVYYSLELQQGKLVTYLNWRDKKYSYWKFSPRGDRNISFAQLGWRGLKLFDRNSRKIAQILAGGSVRFLSLGSKGNLGLYYYSTARGKFEASFKALRFCDLPLSCGPCGVCSSSTNTCKYLQLSRMEKNNIGTSFCGDSASEVVMEEIKGVDTVLRPPFPKANLSLEECLGSCLEDCSCAAAFYMERECFLYKLVGGLREVENGSGFSYWVKIQKEKIRVHGVSSSLLTKILILGGVIDGVALFVIMWGLLYYFCKIHKKTDNSEPNNN
ncbi:G-type lectin S-receptor-like serine/threonine-protein kinase SD2-5 [Ananas comosus]|uniref:non-specific serine/threonine protein kinase n=1 Tax=Ananas comosus TaxID=4615 RepID=A0A6P5G9W1_ANACO|nr:G-type lectin S-receptor-like serine/threonine-protein kinase SD2-5 [Ananas comosus]